MSDASYASRILTSVESVISEAEVVYDRPLVVAEAPTFGHRSTTIRLKSGGDDLLLKVLGLIDAQGLRKNRATLDLQARLAALSLLVVQPIPRSDGALCGDIDTHLAVLFPFVSSSPFDPGRKSHWYDGGTVLGRLHRSGPVSPGLQQYSTDQLVKAASSVWAQRDLPWENSKPSPVEMDRFVEQDSLVHGDYRAQNILFSDDGVRCVLDWDDAGYGSRLIDLSYAMVFFPSVLRPHPPTSEQARILYEGYIDEYPLTAAELTAFRDHLELALVRGIALWATIWRSSTGERRQRIASWIRSYIPVRDRFSDWAAWIEG